MIKGILFHTGEYPIGSSALRIRMWHKGIEANGISNSVIISFPIPTLDEIENSESFVWFAFRPLNKDTSPYKKLNRNFVTIFTRIIGSLKAMKHIKHAYTDIDFIFLLSTGLIEGYFVSRYCNKRNIKLFIEKNDENRRRYKNRKGFLDYLAIYQEDIFDKYIIPKASALMVVSKYLENKFNQKLPNLKVIRSLPSFIDFEYYLSLQKNQIRNISNFPSNILSSGYPNIVFAGSCIFTNGLFFFLECAAELYKQGFMFNILFAIFKGNVDLLYKKAKELEIENFYVMENVLYEYIPSLYQIADILVLPEMGDLIATAGFPGKSAEYLASGKAIIVTDFSNLSDYFINGYNCLMSPLKDKHQYIENLVNLLINASLRQQLGAQAIKTAKESFDYKQGVLPLIQEL